MFNLGFSELIVLGLILIIFVRPEQVPQLARSTARLLNQARHTISDLVKPLSEIKDDIHQATDLSHEEPLKEDKEDSSDV